MFSHGGIHRSPSASMDLEPSAPYASASSFPSPAEYKNGEEHPLAYEKLQQMCGNGVSSSGSFFSKLPFPVPSSSSKGLNLNLNIASKPFPSPPLPQSFQPFSPPVVNSIPERPVGPYLSQNKIAYRIPSNSGTSSASTSVLQGILQKCGIGTASAAITFDPIKQQQQREMDSLTHPNSWKITEKIKNLDDMLRGLEHYSAANKFSVNSDCRKEPDVNQMQSSIAENVKVTPVSRQQLRTDRIGVNKTLSRSEFKAQMDKLTGVIEDRWFYGESKKVETKDAVTQPSFSARNGEQKTVAASPACNHLPSVTSSHLLEEMLRRVAGLERHLTKRHSKKQKGKVSIRRPEGKLMASLLQKQFKRHAIFIKQRLDKTDLAIISLTRQYVKALDASQKEPLVTMMKDDRESYLHRQLNIDSQMESLMSGQKKLNRRMDESIKGTEITDEKKEEEDLQNLSRNLQRMENELSVRREENQKMNHTLEKVQKLYSEQSMEIELCWATINHLCIDNDTFREELRVYHSSLQKPEECSHAINLVANQQEIHS